MKRVCVFAHYDRDNIIDDYVIYYLNALKDVAETIIFVSDCDLEQKETAKLNGIANYIIAQKHGEYDFGSYKRGFLLAKDKGLEFDELIFANDSVYGPFYPLKPIFEKMEKKKCDWWGMTKDYCGIRKVNDCLYDKYEPHIQSYFLVFKSDVFNSVQFIEFINSIKKCDDKVSIIIAYEQGLSKILKKAGFVSKSYVNTFLHYNNLVVFHWKEMLEKHNFPFLKISIPKNGLLFWGKQYGYEEIISKKWNYPVIFIKNNVNRLQNYSTKEFLPSEKILYFLQTKYPTEIYLTYSFLTRKILCTYRRFFRYIRNNF